jgi:diguanylate cyclase
MLWKRKPVSASEPAVSVSRAAPSRAEPAPADEFEPALEALASIVRTIGRYALDAPEQSARQVEQLAEHWSQHLLIRRPKPGDDTRSEKPRRDYRSLVEFVTQQRRTEQTHTAKLLEDFRQTVWSFVHSLNRALTDEAQGDTRVAGQLSQLRAAAERGSIEELRHAALSAVTSISDMVEQRWLRQSQRNLELGQSLASLGRQLEDARREGALDPLTQLSNRRAFDDCLQQTVELNAFYEQTASLLLIDVDHFKQVNDSHGHPAGDEVLRVFSRCLLKTFPGKSDLVARYGGDEFAVVLPQTDLKKALVLAERLRSALRKLAFPNCEGLSLSVSIGASALQPLESVAHWLERADRTLYDAKQPAQVRAAPA